MKKIFNRENSVKVLIISFVILIIFQLLILVNVIPHNIVWGGQLTADNYLIMTAISILILILFLIIIAIKENIIKVNKLKNIGTIGVWIIFVYLVLNLLGNIASAVSIENLLFAPFTLIMAIFALILALSK